MRRWRWWMIALLVSGTSVVPALAASAATENDRTITIELAAPPSLLPDLRVGLWLGAEEVTDRYCETVTSSISVTGRPYLRCTDLPDSAGYRIDLVAPVPSGVTGSLNCGDDVANVTNSPSMPYPGGWSCLLWAAAPGVVIREDPWLLADGRPAVVDYQILSPDGPSVVTCEPDTLYGVPVEWCTGLAPGRHELAVTPPDGYRVDRMCETPSIDVNATWDGSLVVSDEHPLWICSVTSLAAPLSVVAMVWDAGPAAWAADLGIDVRSSDGSDASELCDTIGVRWFAPDPTALTPSAVWLADCPGLGAGTYSIAVQGVPDGITMTTPGHDDAVCVVTVDDTQLGQCHFDLFGQQPTVPDEPTTTAGATTDTLPPTGGGRDTTVFVGSAALVVGAVLTLAAARSSASNRGRPR